MMFIIKVVVFSITFSLSESDRIVEFVSGIGCGLTSPILPEITSIPGFSCQHNRLAYICRWIPRPQLPKCTGNMRVYTL